MFHIPYIEVQNLLSYTQEKLPINQNESTLIIGQNLDDKGQQGNGSGKSGITEALSLLITGATVRNCNVKELIRDGAKSCIILAPLVSEKVTYEIEREFFANTKSSTLRIRKEGSKKDEALTSVGHGNELILDILGVTREDFFNFFLLTKEKYKPFLESSDTRKKEVIGRFFNYNQIDGSFTKIDADISSKQSENTALEKDASKLEGRMESCDESISSIEAENTGELIDSKLSAIESYRQKITYIKEKLVPEKNKDMSANSDLLEESLSEKQTFDSELKQLVENDLANLKGERSKIESEEIDAVKVFDADIKFDRDKITPIRKEIEELSLVVREAKELKGQQELFLKSFIECPKCEYHFTIDSDQSEEETKGVIAECEEVVVETEKEIADLVSQVKSIGYNIESLREDKKICLLTIESELKEVGGKISETNDKISKVRLKIEGASNDIEYYKLSNKRLLMSINSHNSDVKSYEDQIESVQKDIDSLKSDNNSDKRISDLEKQKKGIVSEMGKVASSITSISESIQELNELKINLKSFKSHLSNKSIRNITDYTNYFLEVIGSDLSIEIEGYKTLANGDVREKLNGLVYRRGVFKGSYGRFSAGERSRINLCVDLAIQELVNQSSDNKGLNLLLYDETMDSVDSLGLERISESLQDVSRTVLMITQNALNSANSNTMVICKENGVSFVKNFL